MDITWYGHAAFLLTQSQTGVRVALDPYRAPDVGAYAPIDDWADIVAISHENEIYHSFVAGIRGKEEGSLPERVEGLALLEQPQPRVVHGIPFTATRVYENEKHEGLIAMLGVTMDGIRVLHMGDCGHALTHDQIADCGSVDVLLALAGGSPTISLPDLTTFIDVLKPHIVIPMHFGNDKINLNLRPIEEFLALQPTARTVRRFPTSTVSLSRADLPDPTEIWLLPPAR